MKLTPVQERMVSDYFVRNGHVMERLSSQARANSLRLARHRLRDELLLLREPTVEDEALSDLLTSLEVSPTGWLTPRVRIEILAEPTPVRPRRDGSKAYHALASPRRRWLGVCVVLSEQKGYPVPVIRAAFALCALLAAPFALIIYLGLYLEMYVYANKVNIPRVDLPRLFKAVGATCGVLGGLYAGSAALLFLSTIAYERFTESTLIQGAWGRFPDYNTPLFVAALVVLVPIAILQGLPVPASRSAILRKCLYAGAAIYSLILCTGLATFFTGILLKAIERLAG